MHPLPAFRCQINKSSINKLRYSICATYHSNHLRRKIKSGPDMWIDGKEDEPCYDAAPYCQVCQLHQQQPGISTVRLPTILSTAFRNFVPWLDLNTAYHWHSVSSSTPSFLVHCYAILCHTVWRHTAWCYNMIWYDYETEDNVCLVADG